MNKENFISTVSINEVLSVVCALTLKELFPKVVLAGHRGTSFGFYCDFYFSFSWESNLTQELEERMFSFVKKKEKISFKEMVPYSAREYFLSKKEPLLAELMEKEQAPTVTLAELVGKMFPVQIQEEPLNLQQVGSLALYQKEDLKDWKGKKGIRLYGKAFDNKQDRKDFIKNKLLRIGPSHQRLGKELGLFDEVEEGQMVLLPRGEMLRKRFFDAIYNLVQEFEGLFVSSYPVFTNFTTGHKKIFSLMNNKRDKVFLSEHFQKQEEGSCSSWTLLDSPRIQGNFSHLFCKKNLLSQELISSLHFMTKIFKILDLVCEIVFVKKTKTKNFKEGTSQDFELVFEQAIKDMHWSFIEEPSVREPSKIEWRVRDRLGIAWPVACLYIPQWVSKKEDLSGKDFVCIPMSLFLSFERLLALTIEDKKEDVLKEIR